MPFEPPNSVIMALKPYCLSHAVTGARLVAASWEQTAWPPEKSVEKFSMIGSLSEMYPGKRNNESKTNRCQDTRGYRKLGEDQPKVCDLILGQVTSVVHGINDLEHDLA